MSYLLPTSIEAALHSLEGALSSSDRSTRSDLTIGPPTILAGATDYYPQRGNQASVEHILDLSRVHELRSIDRNGDDWRIGALTTWSDITASQVLPPAFRGLQQAAGQIGSVQIQNVGTVIGNICNASPAADGVPPLLTLGAKVELRSLRQTRLVPLNEFVLGNRQTARRADELVSAVLIPDTPVGTIGSFEKLGTRAYLAISIVMVAALADIDEAGVIRSARIAVGACSEVAQRLPDLEQDLVGVGLTQLGSGFTIEVHHLAPLSPIDDVRASAAYRTTVTPRLIARALADCQAADRGDARP